jgi:hypothetical protein
MIFQEKLFILTEEALVFQEPTLENSELAIGEEESNREQEADTPFPQCWTLYFDGSKLQEGLGA